MKTRKCQYKCDTLTKMTGMKNENNQKEFWKLLKKISPKKPDSVEISPGTFRNTFNQY